MRQDKALRKIFRAKARQRERLVKMGALMVVGAFITGGIVYEAKRIEGVDLSLSEGLSLAQAWAAVDAGRVRPHIVPDMSATQAFHALQTVYRDEPAKVVAYLENVRGVVLNECAFGFIDYCHKEIRDELVSVYRAYVPSAGYARWHEGRRDEFLQDASQDVFFKDARAQWEGMSLENRRNVFDEISRRYVRFFTDENFAITPPLTGVIDASRMGFRGVQVPLGFGPFQLASAVFLDEKLIKEGTFDVVMGVAMHEAQHVVQMNLAAATYWPESRDYLKANGIYESAKIFDYARLGLLVEYYAREIEGDRVIGNAYFFNPIEQDARWVQGYSAKL